MNINPKREVARILENLLAEIGPIAMGFRIQGFTAHILLEMGFSIRAVNSSGHPDIIAQNGDRIIRVEVEADTRGVGLHLPNSDDLASLAVKSPNDSGFFSVLICSPLSRWIVIDSYRLKNRSNKLSSSLLEVLSNREQSEIWSDTFERIIIGNKVHINSFRYNWLVRQAILGKSLII